MSNKIFQDYQNSGLYFSLEEVKARIEDLTTDLRGSESYYRRHQPEVLTKQQREDILLENEIQDEIDFYEEQIHNQEVFGTRVRYDQDIQEEDVEEKESLSLSDSNIKEKEPESRIDVLEKKLTWVQDELYQIVGGIYSQQTQSNVIDNHLGQIYHGETNIQIDEDKESIWPTTRQGDQNEDEIRLLKQQVSKLEGTVEMLIRLLAEKINK